MSNNTEIRENDRLYGFTVTRVRDVEEIEGQLIEMVHDRTGAGLVWAKSTEENKLFSVGFRTLPEDNTGVFHILEHSVLCGSDKYPVKEPFVELLKTSMNTFLNAMTYPDKTLYPISSRMEQDYLNLMGVYLDAVFRPRILTEPNIFYQEGWHIDTGNGISGGNAGADSTDANAVSAECGSGNADAAEDSDAASAACTARSERPVYKGVVFNEMKGAMSDVDQVAERSLGKLLFPDTCYGFNSGGDPDAIPDLTYDDFIRRYKRFYHPSNAYFYLDGDIPFEKTLAAIDEYLRDYDRLDDVPEIGMQEPRISEDVCRYEVSDEDGKAMLVFGRIAGSWEDRDKLLVLSVLTEQLADSNESPLKRAVLSSGLAEDMELYVSDGIAQPYLVMMFRGVKGISDAQTDIGVGEACCDTDAGASGGADGACCDTDAETGAGADGACCDADAEAGAGADEASNKTHAEASGGADAEVGVGAEEAYEASIRASGDRLLEIVRDTVAGILEEGIPERDLEAAVNQADFRFRQYPEPQGLYRANAVLSSWLYGGDPALYLRTGEAISSLRERLAAGEADELAREYFLNTDGFSRLIMLPSDSLGEEEAAREAARIDSVISGMTPDELASLDELNAGLMKWQETPDSDEALATIPQLDIADISRTPEMIGTEASTIQGVTVLRHPVPTNGIVYINAYFPITDPDLEGLTKAALITEFYKDLPTENYSVTELQNEIKKYVGSLSFGIDINACDDSTEECTPVLRARAAVLRENLPHAEDLIIEIMTRTKFDDEALMKELVTQIDDDCRRSAVSSGHRIAMYAARSHYSSRDAAAEAINGFTFTRFMHAMNSEFSSRIDEFRDFALEVISRSVVKEGCVISVTSSDEADISRLIDMLPEGSARPDTATYTSPLPERLGLQVPASVSHSVAAFDLSRLGAARSGSIMVASNIASLAHLWNEIRVKGGAYGTSVSVSRTGGMLCYSYRDPSPARSLEVYKTIPDFLDSFSRASQEDINGFIISTVANTEPLTSPGSKGRSADDFWFSGLTDEKRIKIRSEILDTRPEDLASWHDAFRALAEEGCVCVIGPRQALDACEGLEIVSI